jgi:AcrR family transcriptional regulator
MSDTTVEPRGPRSAAAMQERRQRILAAAVECFQEKGYLGATTDEIAEAAGVTKRTLYRHMGSKQHLLLEIHENFVQEGLRRWQAVVDEGGTPTEQLRRLIRQHVRTVAEYQKEIRVFFEELKHLDEADRTHIYQQRDAYEAILLATLRAGMRTGEFRRLDAKVTTLLVLGSLTELYRWYRPDGSLTPDELAEVLTGTILDGLAV